MKYSKILKASEALRDVEIDKRTYVNAVSAGNFFIITNCNGHRSVVQYAKGMDFTTIMDSVNMKEAELEKHPALNINRI